MLESAIFSLSFPGHGPMNSHRSSFGPFNLSFSELVLCFRAISAAHVVAAASAGVCDPQFDSTFSYTDSHSTLYEYNFSQLCLGTAPDYNITDSSGRLYTWNIGGLAHAICDPGYPVRYRMGRATQFWVNASAPPCNTTAPPCPNIDTGAPGE